MNIRCADALIVHRDDIPMVATHVSLLVLVGALQGGQIVELAVGVLTVTLAAVDARQLFQIDIVHVLRRPEVGQDVLHVGRLVVIRARARSIGTRSSAALVLQCTMRSLDAHVTQVIRRYQIKAELARFHEFDIAIAAVTRRALTTYLLLARHDGSMVAGAGRARLTMLNCAHGASVLHLWHHVALAY